jgi:hypothetical protein
MISSQIQRGTKHLEYLVMALLAVATMSCASTGTPRLSQGAVEKVIEGKSSKAEIEALLGQPEHKVTSDSVGVRNYVRRVLMDESLQLELPDDEYELLTYNKWRYVAIDPLIFPSDETAKICIVIIDRNNICLKIIYHEEGRFEW